MLQPSFEMEESRSVTPWVNRLYFESPRASSFLGLWLVKARHKNLVPLFSGVKPDPMVGSGRYAESIPVKSPVTNHLRCHWSLLPAYKMEKYSMSDLCATDIIHWYMLQYPGTTAHNLHLPGNYSHWRWYPKLVTFVVETHSSHFRPRPRSGIGVNSSFDY